MLTAVRKCIKSDQLLMVYDFVSKIVNERGQVDIVFLDFAKAFELLSYSITQSKKYVSLVLMAH